MALNHARMTKIRSDTQCTFFFEVVLGSCTLVVLIQENDEPYAGISPVNNYLTTFLVVNGLLSILKLILFSLTLGSRPLSRTELYKLGM